MTSDSDQRPPENPPPEEERPSLLQPRPGGAGLPPRRPPGRDQWAAGGESFLCNPFILAGLAVAGAIVMAVFVVIAFGGGTNNGSGSAGPFDARTPRPGRGLPARSIATATVREGPSNEFIEVGLLRSGQDVEVVGRNEASTWFQIFFPPGSQLKGWVPASALRPPENALLPVVAVTPIPRPTVIQPTLAPEATGTATATPTVTATATPTGGPDLVASIVQGSCVVGQRLVVNVRNDGPVPLTNKPIMIAVQTPNGTTRALVSPPPDTLEVGEEVNIDTNYDVAERVLAIVDPLGVLRDPNLSNNRVDCVVGPTGATSTPDPD